MPPEMPQGGLQLDSHGTLFFSFRHNHSYWALESWGIISVDCCISPRESDAFSQDCDSQTATILQLLRQKRKKIQRQVPEDETRRSLLEPWAGWAGRNRCEPPERRTFLVGETVILENITLPGARPCSNLHVGANSVPDMVH